MLGSSLRHFLKASLELCFQNHLSCADLLLSPGGVLLPLQTSRSLYGAQTHTPGASCYCTPMRTRKWGPGQPGNFMLPV